MQSREAGVEWSHLIDERLTEGLVGQSRASGGGDGCGASAAGAVRARRVLRPDAVRVRCWTRCSSYCIYSVPRFRCSSAELLRSSSIEPSDYLFFASALLTHFRSTCALLQHCSYLSVHSFPALFSRSHSACTLCTFVQCSEYMIFTISNALFHFWSTDIDHHLLIILENAYRVWARIL